MKHQPSGDPRFVSVNLGRASIVPCTISKAEPLLPLPISMMISDLPRDLLEEILSRVPATNLRRLRDTCKQWNAIFKDQRFTEKHHRNAPKQSLLVMLKEFRVCPLRIDINPNVAAPSMEFKGALDLKGSHSNSQQVNIVEVFHCDGLLLCTTMYNKLVVWNPCSGETKWIQPKTRRYKKHSRFALGYQNNKSFRSYKILRYWDNHNRDDPIDEFEIYEFSTDSWRVLDDISPDSYIHASSYVSLKGNSYWVAADKKNDNPIFLLTFDFTAERFRRLSPPTNPLTLAILSLVREEQLSLLHTSFFPLTKIELWVTSNKFDTDTDLLWNKSLTVDLQNSPIRYPFFTSFLLDEVKKVVVCCRQISWYTSKELHIIGEDHEDFIDMPCVTFKSWQPQIFNYVPSLVQIQHGQHKRE